MTLCVVLLTGADSLLSAKNALRISTSHLIQTQPCFKHKYTVRVPRRVCYRDCAELLRGDSQRVCESYKQETDVDPVSSVAFTTMQPPPSAR
jgi:hypothetical protein